jgi:hypothetical protein
MSLNDQLRNAPKFAFEVMTAAELDIVVGGGPFSNEDGYNGSNTISQCATDGQNEAGTS